jgi:hypothetical protein
VTGSATETTGSCATGAERNTWTADSNHVVARFTRDDESHTVVTPLAVLLDSFANVLRRTRAVTRVIPLSEM